MLHLQLLDDSPGVFSDKQLLQVVDHHLVHACRGFITQATRANPNIFSRLLFSLDAKHLLILWDPFFGHQWDRRKSEVLGERKCVLIREVSSFQVVLLKRVTTGS